MGGVRLVGLRRDGPGQGLLLTRPFGGGAAEEAAEVAGHLGLVEIAGLQPRPEPALGLGPSRMGGVVEDPAEAEDGAT